eukprot:m.117559 g.117559  ORF g.117559 m.117559 type:complete len:547 (-) comp16100_c1_seq2:152-1792(-)
MRLKRNRQVEHITSSGAGNRLELGGVLPPVLGVALLDVLHQRLAALLAVLCAVQHGAAQRRDVVRPGIALQVARQRLCGHLQVLLVVLEDDALVVGLEIKGKRVCVAQRGAALAQDVEGSAQELDLHPREAGFLQLSLLLLQQLLQLLLQLAALRVVGIPVVVEEVAIQSVTLLLLCVAGGHRLLVVKPAAVVPAAAVRRPWTKADPAKLVPAAAVVAGHVVAAAVLLDGALAFGADFRVGRNPVGRLAVVGALLQPHQQHLALEGRVRRLQAAEAEVEAARAAHGLGLDDAETHGVFAAGARTPLDVPIALDKGLGDKVLVFAEGLLVLENPRDGELVHENVALGCRAVDGLSAFYVDLCLEVAVPAAFAEYVPAVQASHLRGGVVDVADLACELPCVEVLVVLQAALWMHNVRFSKELLLIAVVVPLQQPLLVPAEMLEENARRAGGDLENGVDFLDGLELSLDQLRGLQALAVVSLCRDLAGHGWPVLHQLHAAVAEVVAVVQAGQMLRVVHVRHFLGVRCAVTKLAVFRNAFLLLHSGRPLS